MTQRPVEDFLTIPGWGLYGHVYDRVVDYVEPGGNLVEVGVLMGRMLIWMAHLNQVRGRHHRVFGVDHFFGHIDKWHPTLGMEANPPEIRNLSMLEAFTFYSQKYNVFDSVTLIQKESSEGADYFEDGSVDFCWLDAGHTFDEVHRDIAKWWPKIREGGILAGDDWNPHWSGVIEAVRAMFPNVEDPSASTSWWLIQKTADFGQSIRSRILQP